MRDQETLSDHKYITMEINNEKREIAYRNRNNNSNKQKILTVEKIHTRWNWKKANVDLFSAMLIGHEWTAQDETEPDMAAKNIKKIINKVSSYTIPRIKEKNDGKNRSTYWWNKETEKLLKECNIVRRSYMKSKKQQDQMYKERYKIWKAKQKEYRYIIDKAKKDAWNEMLELLEEDPWNKAYKIALKKLNVTPGNITQRIDHKEINRILNGLFPAMKQEIQEQHENETLSDIQKGPELKIEELENAIKNMAKRNPAPGPDGITTKMMKHVCGTIPETILKVMNNCIINGRFPREWRTSRLILLKKEGKSENIPSSYRPICLTEELTKIYERIIKSRINEHLSGTHKLSEYQYGFRTGRSTTDAIMAVKTHIRKIIQTGNLAMIISLDIKNAFNTIKWT